MGRFTDVLRQVLGRHVELDEVSLSGLTVPSVCADFDGKAAMARYEQLEIEYKEKYGDSWWDFYRRDVLNRFTADFDVDMQIINSAIYHGTIPGISTNSARLHREFYEKWEARKRELYGVDYDVLLCHDNADPRIVKLLLDDAVKTGKWRELPDELQSQYHALVGDGQ